jgi:acetyl-CoA C-acetyltransferase
VDDLSAIDLYSCFPCVVEMAVSALGIDDTDPRGLTVTGGLPYFGGPGNDYTLHAIATMARRLREGGGIGLVSGLGWYATKHSVGIYGAEPAAHGWRTGDTEAAQKAIDASAVAVLEPPELGSELARRSRLEATVVASTVAAGRDGEISAAPVIARIEGQSGTRNIAVAAADEELGSLAGQSLVGRRIEVSGSPPRYRVGA